MSQLIESEAFLRVVESGSFTAAARRLGITKSYASKLVARLEDRLSARLLQRTTRSLRLTEQGEAFLADCRRILAELDAACRLIEEWFGP